MEDKEVLAVRKEDVYSGITQIRDDLVERAGRPRRSGRLLRGLVAAAAALAVVIGGIGAIAGMRRGGNPSNGWDRSPMDPGDSYPGGSDQMGESQPPEGGEGPSGGEALLTPLAAVTYPDGAAWLTQEERQGLTGFFRSSVPALLQAAQGENAVVSPVNVYMALSLLAECAGGETREQLLALLGDADIGQARDRAQKMMEGLFNDDGTYTLKLDNSLWLRDDGEYDRDTVDVLASRYYTWAFRGEMGSDGMNRTIQDWIDSRTGGILRQQLGDIQLLPDTALALVSTVYFADMWQSQFSTEKTQTRPFYGPEGELDREFMNKTLEGTVYRGERFTAVCLNFETCGGMWLLLPEEGTAPEELLSDPEALATLTGEAPESVEREKYLIDLSLPKFDVESRADLAQALADLGVTDAFDPQRADLSGIVPESSVPVWVSWVLHGARVRIDEDGCEGAAYTVIDMPTNADPGDLKSITITFDRPFLFSVISQGVPLFTGVVNQP